MYDPCKEFFETDEGEQFIEKFLASGKPSGHFVLYLRVQKNNPPKLYFASPCLADKKTTDEKYELLCMLFGAGDYTPDTNGVVTQVFIEREGEDGIPSVTCGGYTVIVYDDERHHDKHDDATLLL